MPHLHLRAAQIRSGVDSSIQRRLGGQAARLNINLLIDTVQVMAEVLKNQANAATDVRLVCVCMRACQPLQLVTEQPACLSRQGTTSTS